MGRLQGGAPTRKPPQPFRPTPMPTGRRGWEHTDRRRPYGRGARHRRDEQPAIGTTVLVKNEVAGAHNGAYVVQTVAAVGTGGCLIRATTTTRQRRWRRRCVLHLRRIEWRQLSTTWVMTSQRRSRSEPPPDLRADQGIGSITSGAGITITGTSIAMTTPPLTPGATQTPTSPPWLTFSTRSTRRRGRSPARSRLLPPMAPSSDSRSPSPPLPATNLHSGGGWERRTQRRGDHLGHDQGIR